MELSILIACTCGNNIIAPITKDKEEKFYLSDSIEEKQEGFYCNLDSQSSMKINCSCGNEIRLYY